MPSRTIGHMRIVCPSCSAAYDVPDSLVTATRPVRCARCNSEWVPVTEPAPVVEAVGAGPTIPEPEAKPTIKDPAPPPAPAPPVPVAVGGQSAMERLAASPAQPRSLLPLWLAWGLTAVVIVAATWAAYEWHGSIIAAWPPSARAYAWFGVK